MFYPAGEEPTSDDVDSEDEYCALNENYEDPKNKKKLFSWGEQRTTNTECKTANSKKKTSSFKQKGKMAAQRSMDSEDFRMAVIKGNIEAVKSWLTSEFDVEAPLKGGWTPLMYACDSGNSEIIHLLLDNGGANPNSNKDTFTALMCLCACKNLYRNEELSLSAKLLIDKGARVNARDRHYMSPLMYACQLGHVKIAEILLSCGAEINYQDNRGWTALCYAAVNGSDDLVNLLVCKGGNPKLSTHLGDTPSSLALAAGYTKLADSLDGTTAIATLHTTQDQLTRNVEMAVVSEGGRQFGDLELFLSGLKIRHLEPIFQSHCVDFSRLLMLTDKDLDDMGITQVGVKKTLLDAIADLHKAKWSMPDKPFDVKRGLSLQEYSAILCQLATHVEYVTSSATFLLNHTTKSSGPSPVTMATSKQEQEELTNQIESVVEASNRLAADIMSLEKEVYKGMGSKPPSSKLGVFSSLVKTFGFPVCFAVCGLALCCLYVKRPLPLFSRLFS